MGFGKMLVVLGLALAAIGGLLMLGARSHLRLGRLPGDIFIRGKNTTFYFPLGTCLLLSVVLSLLMWLFRKR